MPPKEIAPTKLVALSPVLVHIGVRDTPKQKSISEFVVELAGREAKEIAQLRAQALKSLGTL
jgi:hypothetical protein